MRGDTAILHVIMRAIYGQRSSCIGGGISYSVFNILFHQYLANVWYSKGSIRFYSLIYVAISRGFWGIYRAYDGAYSLVYRPADRGYLCRYLGAGHTKLWFISWYTPSLSYFLFIHRQLLYSSYKSVYCVLIIVS